jgi:hypothetical protein
MRVVLEVTSGPSAGRKTLLGAGQVLQVGRTEWADFAVPEDGHMSRVHFALETDNASCYVNDLGSSNGTLLNGQPLSKKTVVRSGDELRAGETRFQVRVEGDAPGAATITETDAAAEAAVAAARPAPPPAPRPPANVPYTVETCASGLTLCRGSVDHIQPAELAALLAGSIPLYLIVDFKNLDASPPEGAEGMEYLFDWLDPQAAALVSPVVLAQADFAAWPEMVRQGWGNDAVVCLFSRQDQPTLMAHLRRAIRAKPQREDAGGGILGYCWPSVLAMLLAHHTPAFVSQLLTGIDAVLIELPDLPETWQVYGASEVADELDRLGLVRQSPAEATSGHSEEQP